MPSKHLNDELREAYIDGKLSEAEAEEVEEHMLTCSACYEEFYVDLPRERELRAFAAEHRELGREVFGAAKKPGLNIRLSQLLDRLESGMDEVRAVLESIVDGARLSYLVPQMANIRGAQDNALVVDQMCRDYVLFSGESTSADHPDALEIIQRVRLQIKYNADTDAIQIRMPKGSAAGWIKVAVQDAKTGQELAVLEPAPGSDTFEIPVEFLKGDVSLSFK